jgi:hypothetical protein
MGLAAEFAMDGASLDKARFRYTRKIEKLPVDTHISFAGTPQNSASRKSAGRTPRLYNSLISHLRVRAVAGQRR